MAFVVVFRWRQESATLTPEKINQFRAGVIAPSRCAPVVEHNGSRNVSVWTSFHGALYRDKKDFNRYHYISDRLPFCGALRGRSPQRTQREPRSLINGPYKKEHLLRRQVMAELDAAVSPRPDQPAAGHRHDGTSVRRCRCCRCRPDQRAAGHRHHGTSVRRCRWRRFSRNSNDR
jgi:hypothetical protein